MHIVHESFKQQWSTNTGLQYHVCNENPLHQIQAGIYTVFIHPPQQMQQSDSGLKKKFKIGYPFCWQLISYS